MGRKDTLVRLLREKLKQLGARLANEAAPVSQTELVGFADELRALEAALDAETRLLVIGSFWPLTGVIFLIVAASIILSLTHSTAVPVQAQLSTSSVKLFPQGEVAFDNVGGLSLQVSGSSTAPVLSNAATGLFQLSGRIKLHRLSLPRLSAVQVTAQGSGGALRIAALCPGEGGCLGGRLVASEQPVRKAGPPRPVVLWLGREPSITVSPLQHGATATLLGPLQIDSLSLSHPEELLTPHGMHMSSTSGLLNGSLQLLSIADSLTLPRGAEFELSGPDLTVDEVTLDGTALKLILHGNARTVKTTAGRDLRDRRPTCLRILVFELSQSRLTVLTAILGALTFGVLWLLRVRAGLSP